MNNHEGGYDTPENIFRKKEKEILEKKKAKARDRERTEEVPEIIIPNPEHDVTAKRTAEEKQKNSAKGQDKE